MNTTEFQSAAIAILRTAVGWQTKIAVKLDVQPRTVRRWLEAGSIPDWAESRLSEMMGLTDQKPWPRGEWLSGTDEDNREYIVHLQPPRFIARVVMTGEDGQPIESEKPADVYSGVSYTDGPFVLCEIVWIDQPKAGEITQLLEAACDANFD